MAETIIPASFHVARSRGIKRGMSIGESDDLGFNVAQDQVHVHDLHAKILKLRDSITPG